MGEVWFIASDCCGIFCAIFTLILLLYAEYVMVFVILGAGSPWHVLFYSVCSLLAIMSHCRAQFSDPGAVPCEEDTMESDYKICRWCNAAKPVQSHHCSTCNRCVMRMDHHCPWVNNCVAMLNQKYFILFLFWTSLCCLYSGIVLIAWFVSCSQVNFTQQTCKLSMGQSILAVMNFVEALVFGLFVIIMLVDQLSAIMDTLPIDGKATIYDNLKEVFGEPLSFRWLLPLALPQKLHILFREQCGNLQLSPAKREAKVFDEDYLDKGLMSSRPPHTQQLYSHKKPS